MIPLRTALASINNVGTALLQAITVWTLAPGAPVLIDPVDPLYGIQPAIDRAMEMQSQIGWANLFRGFVSTVLGDLSLATMIVSTISPDEIHKRRFSALADVCSLLRKYSSGLGKS
jgi:hypothetical protein